MKTFTELNKELNEDELNETVHLLAYIKEMVQQMYAELEPREQSTITKWMSDVKKRLEKNPQPKGTRKSRFMSLHNK